MFLQYPQMQADTNREFSTFFLSFSRAQGLNVVLLPSLSNPMLAAPCYDVFLITCKKCFLNVLNSNDFMEDKVSVLNGVIYQ